MRLVVLNANTSASMTEAIGQRARAVAGPATEIVALAPTWGPASVEGWLDAQLSATAMLDRMVGWPDHFDALVMAGFGDVGREALREVLDQPVVDITEAAVMMAQLIGHRYGIVTTHGRARSLIEASLRAAGQFERCASIRALDMPVLSVAEDWEEVGRRFRDEVGLAVGEGAEVICLGSGALAPFANALADMVEVPVVDGVAAAVALAESCHQLALSTSKVGAWATPTVKERSGWPITGP
jgi:allantoin racemase